jgi:hypothetical protein
METVLERPAPSATGFEKLAGRIEGRVFTEGHDNYDESRRIWNALRDRKPAAIVRPKTVQDVVQSARFARANGYLLSAKSGGHGISGGAVRDGGITIDFSHWKKIEIDAGARIARLQPGLTWGEIDAATQEYGLAIPGGKVASIGAGGSILAGGIGWLLRSHGLTIDSLRSVEVVTGDGRLIHVDSQANPDLFWGMRGAGSYLGIATSFEFDLAPVSNVLAGIVFHPIDRAVEVLAFYREFTANAPRELTSVAALMYGPEGGKTVAIGVNWAGDLDEGEKVLAPLRAFGPPAADMIGVMPYGLLQKELAKMTPPGVNRGMKSGFLQTFDDDFIAQAADAFRTAPTPECMMLIEHHGGATRAEGNEATAYPHRDRDYNLVIDAGWKKDVLGRETYFWLASTWNRLRPMTANAAYSGYLDADDIGRGLDAFGVAGFARLRNLKAKTDPGHILASLPGLRIL